MNTEYAVIFTEEEDGKWSATVPDLPGCFSDGLSLDDARNNIQEAIELYVESLREDNLPVPPPVTQVGMVPISKSA